MKLRLTTLQVMFIALVGSHIYNNKGNNSFTDIFANRCDSVGVIDKRRTICRNKYGSSGSFCY